MMSLLSQSVKFIHKAAALMLLSLLASSCQWITDDYDDEIVASGVPQYINITISVSASESPVTRAYPTGGEYGNGAEKGKEIENKINENKVNNILLIFYQDKNDENTNINTSSETAKVVCVKRYAVRPYTNSDLPNSHTHTKPSGDTEPADVQADEILYTTGNQKLDETSLKVGETYRLLVVANADVDVVVGQKIKDVRDKVIGSVYTGTGAGIDATNFVMTSESDATVSLTDPTIDTSDENRLVYYFSCIHIERLAARIDFWARTKDPNTSQYVAANYDATTYDHAGYVYNVSTSNASDHFVLTRITPFNLNNGDEYLLKQTTTDFNETGFSSTAAITYLADEVASGNDANWVLDPNTSLKDGSEQRYTGYNSKLSDVITKFDNTRTVTLAGQQDNKFNVPNGNSNIDNIIVGYAKENTLIPGVSPLYYHATGLAFEGYYYANGTTQDGMRCVFYYFIRHQGEKAQDAEDTAYDAITSEYIDGTKNTPCPSTTAMNFGIVRNNIYRISIESINPKDGRIKINIEEKHWRHVDNPKIYI